MSHSSQIPRSNNLNAPQIPDLLYFAEKANFAGIIIAGIFYGASILSLHLLICPLPRLVHLSLGIIIILFFQCMGALLNPVGHTKGDIKWGLVVHTTTMFSFVTVSTAANLGLLSISYIDNREFSGNDSSPPGPFGYQFFIFSKPINVVPYVMFFLNSCLADGLLVSSTPNPVPSDQRAPPSALPLLCCLCYELLGRLLPLPDVPRFLGYDLGSSLNL
jgi:hypothetical protein